MKRIARGTIYGVVIFLGIIFLSNILDFAKALSPYVTKVINDVLASILAWFFALPGAAQTGIGLLAFLVMCILVSIYCYGLIPLHSEDDAR